MFRDRDRWRVHWIAAGRRRTRSFKSEDEAQLFELKLKLGEVEKAAPKPVTFGAFAETWLDRHVSVMKAPAQRARDASRIDVHLRPALGDLRLDEITAGHVLSVREALVARRHPKTGRPIKPKTVNDILATLRHVLGKAVSWGYLDSNAALAVEYVPKAEQAYDYWTPEESERFWRFARHEDEPFAMACRVAIFTGLRRGELAALERHQVDFERSKIRVDASYCFQTEQRLTQTKNRRIAYLPMVPEVVDVLGQYRHAPATHRFFPPELLVHAAQRLRRLCEKIGCRPIRFHDLRHSFGSALAMAGLDGYTRQRLMRHESAAMTQRYSHLAPDHLAEAIHAISRMEKPTCGNHTGSWSRRPDLNAVG